MQTEADAPQKRAPLSQDSELARRQELVGYELVERARAQVPLREPTDHLDVAQAAGAAFDVRLEVVGRVVIAPVPSFLLVELRVEELGAVPHAILRDANRQLRK